MSLLLPFLFVLAVSAQSTALFPNCLSSMCGDINISYPFWRISGEPASQFCGYDGFGINCPNNTETSNRIPQITLGGHSYYVRKISYNEPWGFIILSDTNVSSFPPIPNPNNRCPRVRHGINLQNLPLSFTRSNVNISFHFNCSSIPSFASEIPCLGDYDGRKSCIHIRTEEFDWEEFNCNEEVVTTVVRDPLNDDLNLTKWREDLEKGFELEWRSMAVCDKCEESGGRCGYNHPTGSICFCSDGTSSKEYCGKGARSINLVVKLGLGLGSALLSLLMVFIIFCILKQPSRNCVDSIRHKTENEKNVEAFIMQYGSLSTKRYRYSEIKKMTNSFRVKLGQGGFGSVFKGKLLLDGRLVAVKVLNTSKSDGQEFINEVASIGRTSHVNIVTLLGFCFEHRKRVLVYEYMPNGSLDKFIHNRHKPTSTSENMGINKFHEIALGVAYGLDYLHRGCNTRILHLDIKPHNILLDEDFCPKIADFGLAKLYSRKESIVSMLEVRGTIGYIAPEVFSKNFGGVSHKSDVYSYGMLLLEMVGWRKNVDVGVVGSWQTSSDIYFPDWIYNRLHKDEFLLDSITTTEENSCARKMTIVGLWCIQTAPSHRPPISEVIEMLEGSVNQLEAPPKPFLTSPPQFPNPTLCTTSQSTLVIT